MSLPEPADPPLAAFDVQESAGLGRRQARLRIYADRLVFESAGQHDCELFHAEHRDNSLLIPLTGTLIVQKSPRRAFFLGGDALRAVQGWIGPPTSDDLKLALRRRLAWSTPMGLMLVVLALPLGGTDFDPLLCIEGLGLGFTGQFARVRPHRLFFLVDAGWFLLVAVSSAWDVLADGGWWWLPLIVLQVALVVTGIQEYQRFAPEKMAAEPIA